MGWLFCRLNFWIINQAWIFKFSFLNVRTTNIWDISDLLRLTGLSRNLLGFDDVQLRIFNSWYKQPNMSWFKLDQTQLFLKYMEKAQLQPKPKLKLKVWLNYLEYFYSRIQVFKKKILKSLKWRYVIYGCSQIM